MKINDYSAILGLAAVAALTLNAACASGADGSSCKYQSDCNEACIHADGDPHGTGTCGAYRQPGQHCTRPGYEQHDCEPGLKCASSGSCVSSTTAATSGGGSAGSSNPCAGKSCPSGSICATDEGVAVCAAFCSSDANCGSGCCGTAGASKVCVPAKYCSASTSSGGGSSGNTGTTASGSNCVWGAANNCVTPTSVAGTKCGKASSIEVTITNNCSEAVKIYSCLQKANGTWGSCALDGNFNAGVQPGQSTTNWTCESAGQFKVWAVKLSTYLAGKCSLPKP